MFSIFSIILEFVRQKQTQKSDLTSNKESEIQPESSHHQSDKKVVYVDMVGDLFHAGHVNLLRQAKQFGNYLIVGVAGDDLVASYKRRPIWNLEERLSVIQNCKYVDQVIPNAPILNMEMLEEHDIQVVVHGSDTNEELNKKYYGAAYERDRTEVKIVPYYNGVSTSETILRILSRSKELLSDKHFRKTKNLLQEEELE